jgi:hypothetical protein
VSDGDDFPEKADRFRRALFGVLCHPIEEDAGTVPHAVPETEEKERNDDGNG